jgi:hypothetical protein
MASSTEGISPFILGTCCDSRRNRLSKPSRKNADSSRCNLHVEARGSEVTCSTYRNRNHVVQPFAHFTVKDREVIHEVYQACLAVLDIITISRARAGAERFLPGPCFLRSCMTLNNNNTSKGWMHAVFENE